jgi:hypothetical protein
MKVLKAIKSFFMSLLGVLFFLFALTMTILLLSYNDYGLSQFGNKTLILMTDKIYSDAYDKGDLVIVEKRALQQYAAPELIEIGDELFVVRVVDGGAIYIEVGKVGEVYPDENAISFENGSSFDVKFVIGEKIQVVKKLGGFLSVVESKWGFLFIVLVPCFLIFIYEIYALIVEIKYGEEDDD